jgi:predicted HTH domain antitoxin
MPTITVDLPSESLAALRRSSEELAQDVRLAAAIYWYAKGELSQERAAEVAGLDRTDFLLACGRAGVNVFQTDADEFASGRGPGHG